MVSAALKLIGVALAFIGAAAARADAQRVSCGDAIRIAEAASERAGHRRSEWQPKIWSEPAGSRHTWTVIFTPCAAGIDTCFFVIVDDRTGSTRVEPGE